MSGQGTDKAQEWTDPTEGATEIAFTFDAADVADVAALAAARRYVASGAYARDARLVSPDGTRHLAVAWGSVPTAAAAEYAYRGGCSCGWKAEHAYAVPVGASFPDTLRRTAAEAAGRDAEAHAVAVIMAGAVPVMEAR